MLTYQWYDFSEREFIPWPGVVVRGFPPFLSSCWGSGTPCTLIVTSNFTRGWQKVLSIIWPAILEFHWCLQVCLPFRSYDCGLSISLCLRFFEESYLPHSVGEGHIKFLHFPPYLLISSFRLWQRGGMKPKVSWWRVEERKRVLIGKRSWRKDGKCRAEDASSSYTWTTFPSPTVSQAGRSPFLEEKKQKSEQYPYNALPPQPLLFCLLCVTNFKCPAGSNYSILMSAVSNNCIVGCVTSSSACWPTPPHLRSPFPALRLPAWCLLAGWPSPGRGTRDEEP